jgi:hypothetical protein
MIPALLILGQKNVHKKVPEKEHWQKLQYPKSSKFEQFFAYNLFQRNWNQHNILRFLVTHIDFSGKLF